jgi:hypothetical protein
MACIEAREDHNTTTVAFMMVRVSLSMLILDTAEHDIGPESRDWRSSPRQIDPEQALLNRNEVSRDSMRKASLGNAEEWKAWKAKVPAFHPSHSSWKSLRDSHITNASTGGFHI